MTDDTRARLSFFVHHVDRVGQLGWRARHKMKGEKFVVVCIDVDDPSWTELVGTLMPGVDWDAFRARGEKPVARGSVLWHPFVEILSGLVPDVAPTFRSKLPDGYFFAVVLAEGGCTVLAAREQEEPS